MQKLLSAFVGLALGIAATGCATPTQPSGPASLITFTYHSVAPVSASDSSGSCRATSLDPRPRLFVSWRIGGLPMDQDPVDPTRWVATDIAPVGQSLEVSLRDPGLCRLASPPDSYYVSSGLSANDVALRHVDVDEDLGGAPCFLFHLTVDGRVFEDL